MSGHSLLLGLGSGYKMLTWSWLCGSVGWCIVPHTKGLWVRFPVRAHSQVAGSIPGWEAYGRQLIDVSLPHSLLFPLKSHFFKKVLTW